MPETVLAPAEKIINPKPKNRFEHQITLNMDDLRAMGLSKGPQVGMKKKITAMAEVIGVSIEEHPEEADKDVRVTLQLRELAFVEEQDQSARNSVIASKLFGE